MTEQAERERAEPLLPTVEPVMEGKELFTCQMAADDFRKILGIMGGPLEKERGEKLLSTLTIVPDDPSPRAAALKESASIKTRAKVIFGTADSLKVIQCVFGRWLIDADPASRMDTHARAHTNMVTCTHTDTHQLIHANKKKHTHTHAHTHERTHERTIICLIMDRKGRRYARRKETSQKIRILLLLRILLLFCS